MGIAPYETGRRGRRPLRDRKGARIRADRVVRPYETGRRGRRPLRSRKGARIRADRVVRPYAWFRQIPALFCAIVNVNDLLKTVPLFFTDATFHVIMFPIRK